ncbi:DUF4861 family protein [Pelagicoccus sp. SDUM812002]|uniref:DUF4861 family protein n=1 Tax=Pelagicoccus sp. SDUM812002 TaxID=3041266 RepID=UPI00280D0392|nr:DUF4861 family protein [Pelagicoccus sp. SDUM812002]MDQ8184221.1 DUF4861 family protein [Pelagicoccus sp. SDUM812002]
MKTIVFAGFFAACSVSLGDTSAQTVGAYVVPRRADDVAWENDKIAFRVYGPALMNSAEDSGVDVWCKRIETPVVLKWYEKEFSREGSYHEDTGEGYDPYKVGGSRGCGGTGIWYEGDFYTSNVYRAVRIDDSRDDMVLISLDYEYDIAGEKLYEQKEISLRKGSYLCGARSHFSGSEKVLRDMKVSVGLVPQSTKATAMAGGGCLTLWDEIDGYWLATGVQLLGGFREGSIQFQQGATLQGDYLATIDLEDNTLDFAFGFAWERHSDFTSIQDWHEYVFNW